VIFTYSTRSSPACVRSIEETLWPARKPSSAFLQQNQAPGYFNLKHSAVCTGKQYHFCRPLILAADAEHRKGLGFLLRIELAWLQKRALVVVVVLLLLVVVVVVVVVVVAAVARVY
jgi:hypothetical protein